MELVERIASYLGPNDIAVLRGVDKATQTLFPSLHAVLHLSLPIPPALFARQWGAPGVVSHLPLKQRRQLVTLTAASGVLQNLRLAVEVCELASPLGVDAFVAAARAGALPVCRWLRDQRCPWSWDTLEAAARAGQTETVQALIAAGCPLEGSGLMAAAAAGGCTDLMEWLLARGCAERGAAAGRPGGGGGAAAWWRKALAAALRNGQEQVVVWLMQPAQRWRGRQGLGGGFPGGRGGGGGGGTGWPDLDADPEAALEAAEILEAAAEGSPLPLLRRLYDYFVTHAGGGEEAVEAAAAAVAAAAKEVASARGDPAGRAAGALPPPPLPPPLSPGSRSPGAVLASPHSPAAAVASAAAASAAASPLLDTSGSQHRRGAADLAGAAGGGDGLGAANLSRQAAALVDALRATTWRGRVLAAAAASATPDWRAKVEFLEAAGLRPVERFGLAVVTERAAAYRARPTRAAGPGAGAGADVARGRGGTGGAGEAVWVAADAGGGGAGSRAMLQLRLLMPDARLGASPHASGAGTGGSSRARVSGDGSSSSSNSDSPRRAAVTNAAVTCPPVSGCSGGIAAGQAGAGPAGVDDALTRLQWLRRKRYPISGAAVFGQAVRANNVRAVPYLLNRNRRRLERLELPYGFSVRPALMAAAEAGQLAVLQGVLDWALNRAAASAAAAAAEAPGDGGAAAHAAGGRRQRDNGDSSDEETDDDEGIVSDGGFGEDEVGGAGAAVLRAVCDGAGAMLIGAVRGGQVQAASWVLDTFGAGTGGGGGGAGQSGEVEAERSVGRSLSWPWKGKAAAAAGAAARAGPADVPAGSRQHPGGAAAAAVTESAAGANGASGSAGAATAASTGLRAMFRKVMGSGGNSGSAAAGPRSGSSTGRHSHSPRQRGARARSPNRRRGGGGGGGGTVAAVGAAGRQASSAAAAAGPAAAAPGAARSLFVELAGWRQPTGMWLTERLFAVAAGSGLGSAVPLMALLRAHRCPADASAWSAAAVGGDVAALEWLAASKVAMRKSHRPYMVALGQGDLATLRCLRRLRYPVRWRDVVREAKEWAAPAMQAAVCEAVPGAGGGGGGGKRFGRGAGSRLRRVLTCSVRRSKGRQVHAAAAEAGGGGGSNSGPSGVLGSALRRAVRWAWGGISGRRKAGHAATSAMASQPGAGGAAAAGTGTGSGRRAGGSARSAGLGDAGGGVASLLFVPLATGQGMAVAAVPGSGSGFPSPRRSAPSPRCHPQQQQQQQQHLVRHQPPHGSPQRVHVAPPRPAAVPAALGAQPLLAPPAVAPVPPSAAERGALSDLVRMWRRRQDAMAAASAATLPERGPLAGRGNDD
ncbi:hypothetical protein HYH02_005169 [Chlamydomonas schloesseri]|uniref:Uncharacterized protein n=1 Tax=Chlamydomonas schloesseri TaxID=2026947 RepID=A0A835WLJ1_9CHLO|nr:hypothetical protein HYH02_005169 [Chlamydomonas schloesseri]|eukprot:KAG2449636.1 hypothetical protein HYH02_005169 [Chlamydomonas schloesseri]